MKSKNVKHTINEMSVDEAILLYEELYSYYPQIKERLERLELEEFSSFSFSQKLEYVVTSSIILWAKVYLGWTARDYQIPILEEIEKSRAVTLRLGRRLGKTDCMCVALLWLAHTQINKGPNNQYNILILTPYETQIDLIFDRLGQLILGSYLLKTSIARDIHHRYELENGTIVAGLTVGASSGSKGGNNTRGQRSDWGLLI